MNILTHDTGLFAYLSYGYVPAIESPQPFKILQGWDPSRVKFKSGIISLASAVSEAADILRNVAVSDSIQSFGRAKHVIFLSGGFDSRAILGSLLAHVDSRSIIACTYGFPGNDEFEFAHQVARAAGVEHHRLDITTARWSTEELLASAVSRDFPPSYVVGARYFTHHIYRSFGIECVFWDGLLAGILSGSRLPPTPMLEWELALADFVKSNGTHSYGLAPSTFDPFSVLPRSSLCSSTIMEFPDQLDICVRQTYYIANRIPDGYRTETPFTLPEYWSFMLGLPRNFREGQLVYKEALARAFPKLFAIPVAGDRGRIDRSRWIRGQQDLMRRAHSFARRTLRRRRPRVADPDINLRVGYEMRDNASLRSVIAENIADLKNRHLLHWIDIEQLWNQHLQEEKDHTRALRILVSLELALKLCERRSREKVVNSVL